MRHPSPKHHTLPPSPLRVAVRDLPVTRHAVIEPSLVAEVVVGMPLREALGDDRGGAADSGELDVELYADETTIFVKGTIKGTIAIACSRCVAPMMIVLDEPLQVTYVPAADAPPRPDAGRPEGGRPDGGRPDGGRPAADADDDGVELTADALDVFPYDGETVDLEALVREQFVLAVPYAPLCREDCQGLCAQCGADKNVAPCDCARPVDPRFATLAGVKLPS